MFKGEKCKSVSSYVLVLCTMLHRIGRLRPIGWYHVPNANAIGWQWHEGQYDDDDDDHYEMTTPCRESRLKLHQYTTK